MRWTCSGVVAASLGLVACGGGGGSDGSGTAQGALLDCAADTMHLKGDIEGTPVDRTEPISGGGLTQIGKGHFDSEYVGPALINDPERSRVILDWPSGVAYGARSTATGTLALPAEEPLGGQTLCATAGTFVGFSGSGTFYFGLKSLASGAACDTPVEGSIDGCWNSPN